MNQEKLHYELPSDAPGKPAYVIDVVLTYDDKVQNDDGSSTITNVVGTYKIFDDVGSLVRSDEITGLAEYGSYGSNDNKIFASGDPLLSSNGFTFLIDHASDADETTTGSINFYEQNGSFFQYGQSQATNVVYSPVCYCEGTHIRTVRGDIAVENLHIGDLVVTAAGAHRPIRWIGHRAYAARFANMNPDLLPIRIKSGAFAEGVPARDLFVSPKHALFLDGVLIPAAALVDGVGVVKVDRVDDLTYWHVELDSHDVILAENTPAESFLNDDSRSIFHNAHTFLALYPEAVESEAIYCAPRVESGDIVARIRRHLADHANAFAPPVSSLPNLGSVRRTA